MAYASVRKIKRGKIESIREEIAIHREAMLKRIEAGASDSAGEQARLAINALNRYSLLKKWGIVSCRGLNIRKECKYCDVK